MNIKETVLNLQKVFDEMGETFSGFQKATGLTCLPGCGKCCLFPDVESTVLECLPMALKLHKEGTLEEWMTKLESADEVCVMWKGDRSSGAGQCTAYDVRPSICRLFGASGYFDKNHNVSLSVCKLIKETYPEVLKKISEGRTTENTPMISQWYTRIQSLGSVELLERRPMNKAILGALELVGFYAQYQEIDV
jgi:Fe-S-cluster containining protein